MSWGRSQGSNIWWYIWLSSNWIQISCHSKCERLSDFEHTHFGSFEFLLTLQSVILYVSHPEPQVRYFLVQALGRREKLPLPFKACTAGGGVNGDCVGESSQFVLTVGEFLPKAPNISFRLMSHRREFEKLSPHITHRGKSWTKGKMSGHLGRNCFHPNQQQCRGLENLSFECVLLFSTFTSLLNQFKLWCLTCIH